VDVQVEYYEECRVAWSKLRDEKYDGMLKVVGKGQENSELQI